MLWEKIGLNRVKVKVKRLKIKSLNQQLKRLAVEGTGLSNWEAEILLSTIEEVYFSDPALAELRDCQLRYSCISASKGPGKPLEESEMVSVLLTLFDEEDNNGLPNSEKQASISRRQRKIMRLTMEAKETSWFIKSRGFSKDFEV